MAIGADVSPNVFRFKEDGDSPGSVQADWATANDDATTAQSSLDLVFPLGIDDATFHPARIPVGATRVLIRAKYDVGADTFTTSPVVRLIGLDSNNTPQRLDTADANATGVTVTCEANVLNDGVVAATNFAYSDVTTLDGYDLKGSKTLYVAVETAASVNDGGVAVAVAIQVLFLN